MATVSKRLDQFPEPNCVGGRVSFDHQKGDPTYSSAQRSTDAAAFGAGYWGATNSMLISFPK